MRTLGKLFIIFTALLALAVAFAWRHFTAPATPETAPRTTTSQRPTAGTSAPALASPTHSSRIPATDPVTAFEALKQRAKEGDAVSQRLLAQTYEACFLANLSRANFIRGYQFVQKQNPEQAAEVDRVVQQRVRQCDAVDGGAIIPVHLINSWYAQAAANGDLASRAVMIARQPVTPDTATTTQFMEDLVASGDPAAMYSLGNSLGERFASHVGEPYRALASGPLSGMAWAVAACRMGYDCGPDSMAATSFCLSLSRCQGETVEELMFAIAPDDKQRQALEQKVQQILDAVAP